MVFGVFGSYSRDVRKERQCEVLAQMEMVSMGGRRLIRVGCVQMS